MKSTKCTIKEAVQVIQDFDFGKDARNISRYIKKNPKQILIKSIK